MSKHTPGTWKVGNHGSVVSDVIRDSDENVVAFYGGEIICESIQNVGDANLIAAAPDLFEALNEIATSMPHLEDDRMEETHGTVAMLMRRVARKALDAVQS